MIPATRKVITRKRARPSQGNHSFTLGVGFIQNPILALPARSSYSAISRFHFARLPKAARFDFSQSRQYASV